MYNGTLPRTGTSSIHYYSKKLVTGCIFGNEYCYSLSNKVIIDFC